MLERRSLAKGTCDCCYSDGSQLLHVELGLVNLCVCSRCRKKLIGLLTVSGVGTAVGTMRTDRSEKKTVSPGPYKTDVTIPVNEIKHR